MDQSLPAPLFMGFSQQEYWSGLPCPPPGDLPDPGIEPKSPVSPALQVDSLLPCMLVVVLSGLSPSLHNHRQNTQSNQITLFPKCILLKQASTAHRLCSLAYCSGSDLWPFHSTCICTASNIGKQVHSCFICWLESHFHETAVFTLIIKSEYPDWLSGLCFMNFSHEQPQKSRYFQDLLFPQEIRVRQWFPSLIELRILLGHTFPLHSSQCCFSEKILKILPLSSNCFTLVLLLFFSFLYLNLFIFNWRMIALQYCVVFCHSST